MAETDYKTTRVLIDHLDLLEKNARFMTHETFRNLVENVKRDGALTSVPFCIPTGGGRYRVLPGNHRAMAAKEAGLEEITIMFTDKELTRQEQVAIQISHNSIEGEDDPVVLKALWDEITDLDLKYYAGLDDKTLGELEKVSLGSLAEVPLDFRTISLIFLPEEADRMEKVLEDAKIAAKQSGHFTRLADFDRTVDAITKTMHGYNVRNSALAVMIILDLFERHITDLQEGWEYGKDNSSRLPVHIATIYGDDRVPVATAQGLKRIMLELKSAEKIADAKPWELFDRLIETYDAAKVVPGG